MKKNKENMIFTLRPALVEGFTSPFLGSTENIKVAQGLTFSLSLCLCRSYCPSSHNGSLSATCPAGHYCPSGTWSEHQYPCPPGSINPHTAMGKPQDCLPCPPGCAPLTADDYELSRVLSSRYGVYE